MNQDKQDTPSTNKTDRSTTKQGVWPKARAVIIVAGIALIGYLVLDPGGDEGSETGEGPITYDDLESDLEHYEAYFKKDFAEEGRLLAAIRQALVTGDDVTVESGYNFAFTPELSYVAVTLYQPGKRSVRRGAIRDSLQASLNQITGEIRSHGRFSELDVANSQRVRILFEIVQSETTVKLNDLVYGYDGHKNKTGKLKTSRFEPGITGLKCAHEGKTRFYMPTDATTRSHLGKNHVLGAFARDLGVAPGARKRSERVRALRDLDLTCRSLTSKAFVTFGDDIIPLYRGHPATVPYSKEVIRETMLASADWLVENMGPDGSFLYYYDPIADSIVDHAHPTRSMDNLYNNILRHSGGTITLVRAHELTGEQAYLDAARRSIEFLVSTTRKRVIDGETAYYVFFNRKSKLGGTGTGLAAIMRYYMATGDAQFNEYATGMARHLISRITEDGEMIGYYIHPSYNGGQPLTSPSEKEKKELFSFYYPGEAQLGLALFEREMEIEPAFREQLRAACKRALDFLVHIRPKKYADLFTALPSDGWLMQAIEEWSKDPEFQKEAYLNFVFDDARSMVDHMYNRENSLYYDNPGTFFYNYGDHAYSDGARAEGFVAAYYLADRLGEKDLAAELREANIQVAKSLLHTYHSPESSFFHPNPERSHRSFRFKLTRQWVRVDSVQHTACFYARLYQKL